MRWFVSTDGKTRGPFEESQLRELTDKGVITVDSQVRDEQGGAWSPIESSPLSVYVASQIEQRKTAANSAVWVRIFAVFALSVAVLIGLAYWFKGQLAEQSRKDYEHCVQYWGGGPDAAAKCGDAD